MLKGIPKVISPELMKVLMEMGHSDELIIADGNFPAQACANKYLVRCDGHGVAEILDAILKFFPLDKYVESPVALIAVNQDEHSKPTIWDEYRKLVNKHEGNEIKIESIGRFAFYERAKKSFAIIATSETELNASIILKKGIVE